MWITIHQHLMLNSLHYYFNDKLRFAQCASRVVRGCVVLAVKRCHVHVRASSPSCLTVASDRTCWNMQKSGIICSSCMLCLIRFRMIPSYSIQFLTSKSTNEPKSSKILILQYLISSSFSTHLKHEFSNMTASRF